MSRPKSLSRPETKYKRLNVTLPSAQYISLVAALKRRAASARASGRSSPDSICAWLREKAEQEIAAYR